MLPELPMDIMIILGYFSQYYNGMGLFFHCSGRQDANQMTMNWHRFEGSDETDALNLLFPLYFSYQYYDNFYNFYNF